MTKKMLEEILNSMAVKVLMTEQFKDKYKGNLRECPFHSELYGMQETLKIMGVPFQYEFDDDLNYIAIKSGDIRVEIK